MNNIQVRTGHGSRLADRAHQILMGELEAFGNLMSIEHKVALHNLEYVYTDTIIGCNQGRIAWPMSVGGGKTESIAALAAAAAELGEQVSLLVSQNTIEALCRLKRRMITLGVPSESIGLVHSKLYDPSRVDEVMNPAQAASNYASEPSIEDSPSNYPILLLSHQMLKTREDLHEFNHYDKNERDLVIWDESLLKSSGRTMDILQLKSAAGAVAPYIDDSDNEDAQAALKFIRYCLAELEAELEAQRSADRQADPLRLPEKLADTILAWQTAIAQGVPNADATRTLQDFLLITQETLRVVKAARGAVIKYDLLIPSTLKRIVVLDASYNIRELVSTFDHEIDVIDSYANVKDFSTVSVNQLWHGGGRSSIDPALRKRNSPLLTAIVERIKTYPSDKGVIVFTYKSRPQEERRGTLSHAELIQSALVLAGVDIEATLPNGRSRFVFLTWGQELGLSNFSYCEYVMQVGIYRQSRHALALSIAGQLDDLTAPEAGDSKTIRTVELSEVFHALYQAAGRGNCRQTIYGLAGNMQLDWIGLETFPDHYWAEAMPGAQLDSWTSSHVTDARVTQDASKSIVTYLGTLPERIDYVSCRTLKPAAGLEKLTGKAFQRARQGADSRLKGWNYAKARRGYVRCPF